MGAPCTKTTLAKSGNVHVERCSCGLVSLHLGSMSLRLEKEVVEQLTSTLAIAMLRNRELNRAQQTQTAQTHQPNLCLVPDLPESGTG